MKKNTLKRVGAILAGIALTFGVSAQTYAPKAPWYKDADANAKVGKTFESVWEANRQKAGALSDFVQKELRLDISKDPEALTPSTYYHIADLNSEKGLPQGMYVTYDNLERNKVTYVGDHFSTAYNKLTDTEVKTGTTFFVAATEAYNEGIGMYPGVNSTVTAEFILSTKGLMNVSEVAVDMTAHGTYKNINRTYNWFAVAHIYNLDGTSYKVFPLAGDPNLGQAVFTADRHKLALEHLKTVKLTTSDYPVVGGLAAGELDNKIIVLHFFTTESKLDDFEGESGENTAITVFSNFKVKGDHPSVAFEGETEEMEAGAGFNTICAKQFVTLNMDRFNSIWAYGATVPGAGPNIYPDNYLTETFKNAARGDFWNLDHATGVQEQIAYLKLSVKYPFVIDGFEIADIAENYTKAQDDYYTIEQLADAGKIGKKVVGDLTTYYIPRDFLILNDATDDTFRRSNVKIYYYFAPQEIGEWDDDYLFADITAEASEGEVAFALSGNSYPFYSEKGEMYFDKYIETEGEVEVTFKNLPNFGDNAITIKHITPADGNATDRYDDDVEMIGWRIIFEDDAEVGVKETFVWGNTLKAKNNRGHYRIDWEKAIESICFDCDWEFPVLAEACTFDLFDYDCTGSISTGNKNPEIAQIIPLFHYHRGDVNVDDKESMSVEERFQLDPTLEYKGKKTITGATLMDKPGEWYEGPLTVYGENQFVWYEFKKDDLMTDYLNLLSPFNFYNEKGNNADVFFAPYDDSVASGHGYNSRIHTVSIFATNLKPDKVGGTTATLRVYKQNFGENGESFDDAHYHTNGFMFTLSEEDIALTKAQWAGKIIGTKEDAKATTFKGTSVKDTLFMTINLNDKALVDRLKNEGLALQVMYKPLNDNNYLETILDIFTACYPKINPNMLDHVGQFAIITNDQKAYNQFHTFGITDAGMVSTSNIDRIAGTYQSLYSFVTKEFAWGNPGLQGIYREVFTKDYDTRFIGTCYPINDSQFIIAGINIMDPVDFTVDRNTSAFKYEIVALNDFEEVPYGEVTGEGYKFTLKPNKYGEMLMLVSVKFDPSVKDRELLEGTTDIIPSGMKNIAVENMYVAHLAQDTILITPQQRYGDLYDPNSKEPGNHVYFFDLDKKHNNSFIGREFEDIIWGQFGIFAQYIDANWANINFEDYSQFEKWYLNGHYKQYVTDELTTEIYGDVKAPKIWFSTDYAGTQKIGDTTVDFGELFAGDAATKNIYIQGRDLPHYGTTSEGTFYDQVIKVAKEGNLLSGFAASYDIRANAIATAAAIADGKTYSFTGVKGEVLTANALRGDVVIEVPLKLTSQADLCDNLASLSMSALCGVNPFADGFTVKYNAILKDPVIKKEASGEIGGSSYVMKWDAVTGADFYIASIGKYNTKYKSENIFISEVYVDPTTETLFVELFNGTGNVINPYLTKNYWMELIVQEGDKEAVAMTIDLANDKIQGSDNPFWDWKYEAFTQSIDISKWGLTSANKVVKYTIRLMEGVKKEGEVDPQIDIYYFNTSSTWLTRVWDIDGVLPMNHENFNIADWSTEDGSLINGKAFYEWENYRFFDAEGTSAELSDKAIEVTIKNLKPKTNYTARLQAFSWCILGEDGAPIAFEGYHDIPFSNWATGPGGDIEFIGDWSGIEMNDASEVTVVGEYGKVSIMGASGKKAIVTDIVGRKLGERVLNSNYESFNAPAGVVIVTVDGEPTTKALVK